MSELSSKQCQSCKGDVSAISQDNQRKLLQQLEGWEIIDNHHLTKSFTFSNFAKALEMVNSVGAIAEEENHHPDIYLAWGKVRIEIWTHAVDGLTESDFILAAKIDVL